MKTTLGRRWLSLLLTLVLCLGLSQAVWAEDPPAQQEPKVEITLNKNNLSLTAGESGTLTATVKKNGTAVENPKVEWKSSDETIATVANGTVTAVAPGSATITATYTYTVSAPTPDPTPDPDGSGSGSGSGSGDSSSGTRADETKTVTATCTVTVSAAPTLTGLTVTLNETSLSMLTGESQKLTATVTPAWSDGGTHNLDTVTYTWKSTSPGVATVKEEGAGRTAIVRPVSAGSTEIEVTAVSNGKTATAKCAVIVEEKIEGLSLDKSGPFTMDVGKYEYITATANPESAIVSWESKDEAVVEASSSDSKGREGILYARAPGKTEVTVSTGSTGNLAVRKIQVDVSGLVLDERQVKVKENETASLPKLTAYGAAKDGKVVWQSANPNIAQISGNSVAGRGPGTTTITASVSGSYQVSVTVTVSADKETTIGPLDMKISDQLNFGDSLLEQIRNQASEGKLSHVTGIFVSPSQGTLYYKYTSPDEPNAGVAQRENYYYAPSSGQKALGDITFIPNPQFSGTQAVISYTVVSTTNQTSSGRILINLEKDSKAVINLGTPNSTPVFFSGNLFNRQCQQKTGSTLDYVIFSLPPANKGTLYFGYVDANNYGGKVTAGAMYRLAQLDSIVFVPAEGVPRDGKSETVTVYYTARSMAGGSVASYAGQVDINVTRENSSQGTDVYYSISKGATKTLDDADFTNFYGDKVLSYIRFDSLPASWEGTLYHGYRSASSVGTVVRTDTNYYSGTRNPRLDRITFVPAEDFTGSVYIPFTGWDQDGNRFPG